MSAKDGGPAFPFDERNDDGTHFHSHAGLTVRDYFAAKAMQAMIATAASPCLLGIDGAEGPCAAAAYRIADAMLRAREATP